MVYLSGAGLPGCPGEEAIKRISCLVYSDFALYDTTLWLVKLAEN